RRGRRRGPSPRRAARARSGSGPRGRAPERQFSVSGSTKLGRPARWARLGCVEPGPVVPGWNEDLRRDGAVGARVHLVRDVRRDRPGVAGAELAGLVSDPERERAGEEDAELLVLVAVLGDGAVGVELDDAERGALAFDQANDDALPDFQRAQPGGPGEAAHDACWSAFVEAAMAQR